MKENYLRKYFIMGSQDCHGNPRLILKEALEAGITAFQYREKGKGSLQGRAKISLAMDLRKLCRQYKIPFIINDDVHLADLLDVDGIHLGQEDERVEVVREKHPGKIIGLSISNEEELKNSPVHLIDYIGAGPIFQTNTKKDAKAPVGKKWIKKLQTLYPNTPIVGIGGINENNAKEVIEAGASGLAVISAITKAKNPQATIRKL